MTADRIKEIQSKTAFPDSVSVCQALLQVWNECQLNMADKKYTEDDIKETAYFFASKKLAENQGILDEEIQDFINSLNKQH